MYFAFSDDIRKQKYKRQHIFTLAFLCVCYCLSFWWSIIKCHRTNGSGICNGLSISCKQQIDVESVSFMFRHPFWKCQTLGGSVHSFLFFFIEITHIYPRVLYCSCGNPICIVFAHFQLKKMCTNCNWSIEMTNTNYSLAIFTEKKNKWTRVSFTRPLLLKRFEEHVVKIPTTQ